MGKISFDVTKSAKTIAQKAAKQIAQEPFEVLKQARRQVTGEEAERPPQPPNFSGKEEELPPPEKEKIQRRDTRLIQALEQELKDIRKQKEFEEAKKKEEERQIEEEKSKAKKGVPAISTKPSRRFLGFGAKQKAESLKTRVEKPLPPTG